MSDQFQSAEQIEKRNVERMGPELGKQYSQLWQRTVRLHIYWREYLEMFGSNPKRVAVMNDAAPAFFRMVQDELWDAMLMHLARLTDKSVVSGQKNLTIRNLTGLIDREPTRTVVESLVVEAIDKTAFCRRWRNFRIAHDDLANALKDQKARSLGPATTKHVDEALAVIASAMKAVHAEYLGAEMIFEPMGHRRRGAVDLLYVIRDGIKQREERRKRITEHKPTEDDFSREAL